MKKPEDLELKVQLLASEYVTSSLANKINQELERYWYPAKR